MKKIIYTLPAIAFFLALSLGHSAWGQTEPGYYDSSSVSEAYLLAPEELEDLVAPIALYPDPLIAQILPAATFVDQIDEAARYVRQYGKAARIDDQPWDVSVRAVAHYPEVLFMMDQKYDWTVALGQAFIDQQQEVMDAIQTLRAEARDHGNLFSTREQQVIYEDSYIRIVPAVAEYVYVPVYDPQVVYVERYNPVYPFITFGVGFTIGAWLSRDCDWRQHRVYYHGWQGRGWVSRSRPHIHDRRGIYINRRAAAITVNNRVMQHDTRRFREQLRSDTVRRREQRGLTTPPSHFNRPRPGRVDQPRPGRVDQPRPGRTERPAPGRVDQPRRPGSDQQAPAVRHQSPAAAGQRPNASGERPAGTRQRPAASGRQTPPATVQPAPPATVQPAPPATILQTPPSTTPPSTTPQRQPGSRSRPDARSNPGDVFRGRDVQKTQPASRSGYGGYGSSKDATIYRERGQTSRENMRQIRSATPPAPVVAPAPRPVPVAPAARPVVPAPRPAPVAPAARPVVPASPPVVAPAPAPAQPRMERPDTGRAPGAQRPAGEPATRPSAPERQQRR